MRVHWLLLGSMVLGGVASAACVGETDTNYGQADGIVGRQAPTATSSATGSTTSTATSTSTGTQPPSGDGGTMSTEGDSGTATSPEGGTTTGSCAVSWTNDVFPMLESTGTGACGNAACHANGGQQPTVLDGNATGTYNSFKGYTLINNVGYITPGNTNVTGSAMDCNLVTGSCGADPMPLAPTGTLSATQKTAIDTWIKCGAPLN
jgi:hypothetical protein